MLYVYKDKKNNVINFLIKWFHEKITIWPLNGSIPIQSNMYIYDVSIEVDIVVHMNMHHWFAGLFQLAGASYMDIHEAGGGINYTVEQTRKASHDELYRLFVERLNSLLKSGELSRI